MGIKSIEKQKARKRRHRRSKKKIFGTAERPRVSVYKSNKHLYAQIIDDVIGHTLVSESSLGSDIELKGSNVTVEVAREIGLALGKKAIEKGIKRVVFDRSGYRYHGQIKALADGAREAGLEF